MLTKWNQRVVLLIAALLLISSAAIAATSGSQENVWEQVEKSRLQQPGIDASRMPSAYEAFRLNKAALNAVLAGGAWAAVARGPALYG